MPKTLKRFLARREIAALLSEIATVAAASFAVCDNTGALLFGEDSVVGQEYALLLNGKRLGTVQGGPAARLTASLLDYLLLLERDKKAILREALERYKEINLLYEISERLAACLDPREAAALALEETRKIIALDRIDVLAIDEKSGALEVLASWDNASKPRTPEAELIGVVGSVLASGKAEIINHLTDDQREGLGAASASALMCAPLKVKNVVIGVIKCSSDRDLSYRAGDLMTLSAIASQAAAAIETARLYKELEDKVTRRTRDLRRALDRLEIELHDAATYVKSLLPQPISSGPLRVDWRFVPSASLGGDALGYQWLDDEHFAMYLLDVSGHGVGAALLSVSALNLLRTHTLPDVDLRRPDQVLCALNAHFPMTRQNEMFFTLWYGVYNRRSRVLEYASAGHPPALLFSHQPHRKGSMTALQTTNLFIGSEVDLPCRVESHTIEGAASLYIFSDGVYEIEKPNGEVWPFDDFLAFMALPCDEVLSDMDRLFLQANELYGRDPFPDDFTIMVIDFDA